MQGRPATAAETQSRTQRRRSENRSPTGLPSEPRPRRGTSRGAHGAGRPACAPRPPPRQGTHMKSAFLQLLAIIALAVLAGGIYNRANPDHEKRLPWAMRQYQGMDQLPAAPAAKPGAPGKAETPVLNQAAPSPAAPSP